MYVYTLYTVYVWGVWGKETKAGGGGGGGEGNSLQTLGTLPTFGNLLPGQRRKIKTTDFSSMAESCVRHLHNDCD